MTLDFPFDYKKPRPDLIKDMKANKWKWPNDKFTQNRSKELEDFMQGMLQPDFTIRSRLIQVINHKWIRNDYKAAHALSDQLKREELEGSKK